MARKAKPMRKAARAKANPKPARKLGSRRGDRQILPTRERAMDASPVNLNTMIPLQVFRTIMAGHSLDDMRITVQQAQMLFDELYAHLPLKEAMHAIKPVQRLMV